MLTQETIQKIESLLKIKGLADAIKAEDEKDITIDDKLSVFSEEEVNTLKSNSYKEGKKAGVEMEVDDLKKEMGLDFQGKTVKGLAEALKKKTLDDAKIEPEKQVQELQEKLTTVQNSYKELENKFKEKEGEVESTLIKTDLYKYIPSPSEEGPALDQDDIINLMKVKGYEFKREEGKVVAYKGGKKVTDNLGNDVEPKNVVEGFLKDSKLISTTPTPGGRGAGDQKPAKGYGSLKDIKADFEAKGKSTLGEEFSKAVQEAAKNPEFKMDA